MQSLERPSQTFSSSSCNRNPGALSTLPPNHAAYASSTTVQVLTNLSGTPRIKASLTHESPITSIKLLHHSGIPTLLAASTSGTLSIWTFQKQTWTLQATLQLHSASCIALDAISSPTLQIATVSTDGSVLHTVPDLPNPPEKTRSVASHLGTPENPVLPECISARPISSTTSLLAVGGTDRRIRLFASCTNPHTLHFLAHLDGHRDWIRSLSFSSQAPSQNAFDLASASKDSTARIFHFDPAPSTDTTQASHISLENTIWSVRPIALLDEHTAPVHSVSFTDDAMHLVTSSMDCSVAVWSLSDACTCVARFGLLAGSSAHALGFFGAAFITPDATAILGHNFAGALHLWRAEPQSHSQTSYVYMAHSAPSGHFAPVMDIAWEPRGRYLLSVSTDKTARIFAEVSEDKGGQKSFVEWARPQVHGHSLFAAAFADRTGRRYVSGGEERMLRVFDAPAGFVNPGEGTEFPESGPVAACVPELGLSNKAVFADGSSDVDMNTDSEAASFGTSRAASVAPLEEDLKQNRLWPEVSKLYGHGNEISCLAVDIENGVIASACRAQAAKDAVIVLWDVKSGVECGRLAAHELTVNEMQFSKNGCELVSVSRDRSFAVFRRSDPEARFAYRRIMHAKGAHSRLIYTCAWVLEDQYVVTGGRDKYLKVFRVVEGDGEAERTAEVVKEKFNSGVSALACTPIGSVDSAHVVAVGFESGRIQVFSIELDLSAGSLPVLKPMFLVDPNLRCGARVTRLRWRPHAQNEDDKVDLLQLGVSSEDRSVRVYTFERTAG